MKVDIRLVYVYCARGASRVSFFYATLVHKNSAVIVVRVYYNAGRAGLRARRNFRRRGAARRAVTSLFSAAGLRYFRPRACSLLALMRNVNVVKTF